VLGCLSAALPSGMMIHGMRVMVGPSGKRWLGIPAEKAADRDGNAMIDAKGRQIWNSYIEFVDRSARDRFTELVLAALRGRHSELSEDDAGGEP
jgi:hypothetical protein